MKLLSVTVPNGFRMLEKNFTINFLTKTRVNKNSPDELFELEEGLYYPYETIFLGKNSSGKSSVIDLLNKTLLFLDTGRFPLSREETSEPFSIRVIFYDEGIIYRYDGTFSFDEEGLKEFPIIKEENLSKTVWKRHYRKDLSNLSFFSVPFFTPNNGGDTSFIAKMFESPDLNFCAKSYDFPRALSAVIRMMDRLYGPEAFDALLHLFDDSIERIRIAYDQDKPIGYEFKRMGNDPVIMSADALRRILSEGTCRGVILFGVSLGAFKLGGEILVDEIERNFNRNLVENLMILYNDPEVNEKHATLVYTTHYSELLDHGERCDNINVLHRVGNNISLKNLNEYELRTDVLKSNQFNQNAFDTFVNYERLAALRAVISK